METIEALPDDIQIYYADECGFEEYYARTYGYSQSNQRVHGEVCGKKFGRTSVVAARHDNKFVAPFAFKGYMNGDLFEGWLESVFVPCLENPLKSLLVIDNASHHRKGNIQEISDEYGFSVMFLPKYSPDLNPIETSWANVKNKLRLNMHLFDSFWDALCHAFK